ncbi:MAG TPA: spermidine/putrescine ABC transporter substrate-binding protein [Actinomycetota bacterium]
MRLRSWRPLLAVVAALAVFAAACGDDGGETGDGGDTGGQGPTTATTGATGGEELGGSIVVSNWDAYMPEDLIPSFEEATGVDVELAIHTTNEDIMGKITAQNGGGFDVVFVSGQFVQPLVEQGWAAELDHSALPNLANLYPEANELGYDPGNTHSAPYAWGTTGICYRTDLVSEPPTSWSIFHDPPAELDGKMTMLGTDRWLLQPALLSLGYSINTTDPAEIEAATQWTLEAKQHLLGFDDTTFYSKLVSGEALAVHAWDGWCEYGRAEEPNIEFVIPDEGGDLWTDTMVILESSQNKDAAHAFIDFVLEASNGKAISELVLYKVPNQAGMEQVDPTVIESFPTLALEPAELLAQEPVRDVGTDGIRLWTDAVTQIRAG